MSAVEVESFVQASFGLAEMLGFVKDVADVADGVGQALSIIFGAVQGDGFLVMGERGLAMMEIALDGAEPGKSECEMAEVFAPAQVDGFEQSALGVGKAVVPPRLESFVQ